MTSSPPPAPAHRPAPRALPQIDVSNLKVEGDPSSGLAVVGDVVNRSQVEQRRLVVFVVGRQGAKVVAAGRAIVPKLGPGAKAHFSAFPIGNPTGARLEASAPPTVSR